MCVYVKAPSNRANPQVHRRRHARSESAPTLLADCAKCIDGNERQPERGRGREKVGRTKRPTSYQRRPSDRSHNADEMDGQEAYPERRRRS